MMSHKRRALLGLKKQNNKYGSHKLDIYFSKGLLWLESTGI